MTPRRLATWTSFACLIALPLVLFAPFRHAGFVADDFLFAATPASSIRDILTSTWAHPLGITVAYRPLTTLTYLLNQFALGGDPAGFHVFNYLVHGVNAALLALVVWRFTDSMLSGVVAGVAFAMHPVTHESVLWISGRTYPLASLFSLAAIAWILRRPGPPRRVSDHVVLGGLVVAALLSYEAALVLPAMIAGVALLRGEGRSLPYVAPLLAVVAYLAVRYLLLTTPADDLWLHLSRPESEFGAAPLLERVRVNSLGWATRLLATGVGRSPHQSTTFAVTLVTSLVLAWAIVRQRHAWRAAGAALLVTLVAFMPFASYIGFADRFAYLSAAGMAMFLGTGIGAAWPSARLRFVACCLLVGMLALWGRQYLLAARDWVTAGQIARDVVADLHQLVPSPVHGAHLHFVEVPHRHVAALVFITYLDRAVNLSYGRDDLVVSTGQAATRSARCATVLLWTLSDVEHGSGDMRLVSTPAPDCQIAGGNDR